MTEQGRVTQRGTARRKRMTAAGVAALLALSAPAGFVPQPVVAQSYSFSSVVIEGNRRVEDGTVLSYAGISRGQRVSGAELNDAYQNLVQSGLFESVELTPRGNTLVIEVVEQPTINIVNFEGNSRLNDEELAALVQSRSRRAYSPAQAERDAAAVTEAYIQQGRLSAIVSPKIIRRSDNRVDLVFEVFEGGNVEIERLSFVGNRVYSDRRLRRVLETKQAGLLRLLVQRDTYVSDRIEFDKQLLRDFYQSRGYVDFRTNSVSAEVTRERDGVFVTFNVVEGQQFKFGRISASTDIEGLDTLPFREEIRVRPGVVYSPLQIENTIERLERVALAQGQDFIRVEPQVTRNDRDLTLDVDFRLTRGPRVFVERIDIEGNTTTLDRVIRQQFRVVEGDPFNPREIRASAERIRALGFFSNADVNAREGSTADQVVIDVDVTEQPTGSLSFGANFSTSDGFGIVASLSERNFLGRGQLLNFSISTAEGNQRLAFSFAEPAFLGRDLRFGIGLSYRQTDNDDALYDTTRASIQPSFTFPVSENGRLQVRYTAAYSDLFGVDEDASVIIRNEARDGARWDSSLGYTYSYDTRRTGLNPNAGVLLRFGQNLGGLGGDTRFIETTASATAQTTVMNEEVTVSATIEGGALNYIDGDNSRVTDRYFMGPSVMRGFEPGGIGPRDADTDDALGGNLYAVARFEVQFPLGLPEEYGIAGGAFYDMGSLWDVGETYTADVLYDDFSLRQVVGLSLFWETPIGPLRFNWTEALAKEDEDEEQNFDLTISTQF
ncbi:Beta-barrel assembly machine subunit BamA [Poseidonocella pacifica]|uniref:Outer membrane protein assembly factor BamA n=1 Tax=Poseidonocella pacifica TaxID=871651 RepID=A0A1I0VSK3_9RHOB|nr:outer membrane protein assembly factor BamA [Poseidonocella pacifica]SFA79385.1 Beta-barrel assembly machine subunit BamA [Poseidonocella pacifica]